MANTPYVLPVNDTISTAWHKVSGAKATIWAAIGMMILISIGFAIIEAITKAVVPSLIPVVKIIAQIIMVLLQFGTLYIGIKRAYDLPISWDMMFRTFDIYMALKTIGLYILEAIIFLPMAFIFIGGIIIPNTHITGAIFIAFLLCIIAVLLALYVAMRLVPAMAFVLDKEVNPLQAIKMSFAATRENFAPLFLIFIFQMFVIFLSVIPLLGIGLIWSLPLVIILFGEMYKRLLINVDIS